MNEFDSDEERLIDSDDEHELSSFLEAIKIELEGEVGIAEDSYVSDDSVVVESFW